MRYAPTTASQFGAYVYLCKLFIPEKCKWEIKQFAKCLRSRCIDCMHISATLPAPRRSSCRRFSISSRVQHRNLFPDSAQCLQLPSMNFKLSFSCLCSSPNEDCKMKQKRRIQSTEKYRSLHRNCCCCCCCCIWTEPDWGRDCDRTKSIFDKFVFLAIFNCRSLVCLQISCSIPSALRQRIESRTSRPSPFGQKQNCIFAIDVDWTLALHCRLVASIEHDEKCCNWQRQIVFISFM